VSATKDGSRAHGTMILRKSFAFGSRLKFPSDVPMCEIGKKSEIANLSRFSIVHSPSRDRLSLGAAFRPFGDRKWPKLSDPDQFEGSIHRCRMHNGPYMLIHGNLRFLAVVDLGKLERNVTKLKILHPTISRTRSFLLPLLFSSPPLLLSRKEESAFKLDIIGGMTFPARNLALIHSR